MSGVSGPPTARSSWGALAVAGALLACSGPVRCPPTAAGSATDDPNSWQRKCTAGDGQVCGAAGSSYERGGRTLLGDFPQDFTRAAQYYAAGCKNGYVPSCGDHARLLAEGKGVERNQAAAFEIAKAACDKKDGTGCWVAGNVLLNWTGPGQPADDYRLFIRWACALDVASACKAGDALEGTARLSTAEPPVGAVGFRFGMSTDEARAACERGGHAWAVVRADRFTCNGTPDALRFQADVQLDTCGASGVCSLAVAHACADGNACFEIFAAVEDEISKQYGLPTTRDWEVPPACKTGKPELAKCLAERRARVAAQWYWNRTGAVLLNVLSDRTHLIVSAIYVGAEALKGEASRP